MNHGQRLADPSYVLARADYDLGWWEGFQLNAEPPAVITRERPNVTRGYADGIAQRSTWAGANTARRLSCQLLGQPITPTPRLP